MPDEPIDGVKFSEFPSATPDNADEVVGLHAGNNARFSVANLILAVRQGLANLFVPLTRTINNKALNADITLDATDVGAYELPSGGIPKTDLAQGVQDSLDDADSAYQMPTGGIPATDLASGVIPTVPSISTSIPQMDSTGAAGSTGLVSDAGHTHPSDTTKANEMELAHVETGTTASKNYAVGEYFCWGGTLYRAKTAISSGAAFTVGTNCESVSGGGMNDLRGYASYRLYKNMNWQITHSVTIPGELCYMVSLRYFWFAFVQRYSDNTLNIRTVIGTPPTYTNSDINYTFTMPNAADLTVIRL